MSFKDIEPILKLLNTSLKTAIAQKEIVPNNGEIEIVEIMEDNTGNYINFNRQETTYLLHSNFLIERFLNFLLIIVL